MENLSLNFAENIRKLRKRAGLSQKDFAQMLSCSEKTVSKWECGNAIPGIEVLLNISGILHASIEELFTKEGMYFLGIDGGGTKTALLLQDESGNIVRKLEVTGCNPMDIGFEKSAQILRSALYEICGDIAFSRVYVFSGVAGGTSGDMPEKFNRLFSGLGFAGFSCDSDNRNIIAAGLGEDDGISLILGTGICAYIQKNKKHSRIAGWGYLIDNGGSGYNLGRDALNAYLCALDKTGQPTAITEEIDRIFSGGAQKLMAYIYSGGKKTVASFAPVVFSAAEKNDAVAIAILQRNMKEAAHIVETASKNFSGDKVKVVVAGGLTNCPVVIEYLKKYLKNPQRYDIQILDKEPVYGALMLAKGVKENA